MAQCPTEGEGEWIDAYLRLSDAALVGVGAIAESLALLGQDETLYYDDDWQTNLEFAVIFVTSGADALGSHHAPTLRTEGIGGYIDGMAAQLRVAAALTEYGVEYLDSDSITLAGTAMEESILYHAEIVIMIEALCD